MTSILLLENNKESRKNIEEGQNLNFEIRGFRYLMDDDGLTLEVDYALSPIGADYDDLPFELMSLNILFYNQDDQDVTQENIENGTVKPVSKKILLPEDVKWNNKPQYFLFNNNELIDPDIETNYSPLELNTYYSIVIEWQEKDKINGNPKNSTYYSNIYKNIFIPDSTLIQLEDENNQLYIGYHEAIVDFVFSISTEDMEKAKKYESGEIDYIFDSLELSYTDLNGENISIDLKDISIDKSNLLYFYSDDDIDGKSKFHIELNIMNLESGLDSKSNSSKISLSYKVNSLNFNNSSNEVFTDVVYISTRDNKWNPINVSLDSSTIPDDAFEGDESYYTSIDLSIKITKGDDWNENIFIFDEDIDIEDDHIEPEEWILNRNIESISFSWWTNEELVNEVTYQANKDTFDELYNSGGKIIIEIINLEPETQYELFVDVTTTNNQAIIENIDHENIGSFSTMDKKNSPKITYNVETNYIDSSDVQSHNAIATIQFPTKKDDSLIEIEDITDISWSIKNESNEVTIIDNDLYPDGVEIDSENQKIVIEAYDETSLDSGSEHLEAETTYWFNIDLITNKYSDDIKPKSIEFTTGKNEAMNTENWEIDTDITLNEEDNNASVKYNIEFDADNNGLHHNYYNNVEKIEIFSNGSSLGYSQPIDSSVEISDLTPNKTYDNMTMEVTINKNTENPTEVDDDVNMVIIDNIITCDLDDLIIDPLSNQTVNPETLMDNLDIGTFYDHDPDPKLGDPDDILGIYIKGSINFENYNNIEKAEIIVTEKTGNVIGNIELEIENANDVDDPYKGIAHIDYELTNENNGDIKFYTEYKFSLKWTLIKETGSPIKENNIDIGESIVTEYEYPYIDVGSQITFSLSGDSVEIWTNISNLIEGEYYRIEYILDIYGIDENLIVSSTLVSGKNTQKINISNGDKIIGVKIQIIGHSQYESEDYKEIIMDVWNAK